MAKDVFHNAVGNGLEKEGWVITDDPLRIKTGGVDMQISKVFYASICTNDT